MKGEAFFYDKMRRTMETGDRHRGSGLLCAMRMTLILGKTHGAAKP